ncbi:MAG: GIY-YIG nuclease family protein [Bacteroidales bacterium]|nr:GIY-YIG nuclease family protein [Bacteroidales bacterium]
MEVSQILPEYKRKTPKVYAYSDTNFPGQLKIGYTEREDVMQRIREQHPIKTPQITYQLEWYDVALYDDGSGTSFTDKDIHRYLKRHGFRQTAEEWFECSLQEVKSAYIAVKNKTEIEQTRFLDFSMRPEQAVAVEKTYRYFKSMDESKRQEIPHFLWNAKMRFGKTFTTYQLAKRMGAKRVLVLTFKPAVEESWHDDLMYHKDFEGWQFYSSKSGESPTSLDDSKPIVCFGSFQDYLGEDKVTHGIKLKNEWVHAFNWDLIVLDEYHFGAWNENAKRLLDIGDSASKEKIEEQNAILKEDGFDVKSGVLFEEDTMPITGKHFLYLSGTPFRALSSGEFLENQIFNWTYQDEQKAKGAFEGENNPYEELPTMVLMTYQMPDDLGNMIEQYDMNEFDLNEFFKAEGIGENASFVHENAVQKWLDIIRGKASIFNKSDSPLNEKPALPFDDTRLLDICNHTMWFLYSVASCDAMENLLHRPANNFYHNYRIVNCSGTQAGIGLLALDPVREAMTENPITTKTITLTCGKLTTGVTIKPLSGILMLRNCSSPETYFQSAFRVQSPWTIPDEDDPTKKVILKPTCYVFDFAPNRALREVVDYANQLSVNTLNNAVQKVDEFINFLPILQFDGSSMKEVNANEILDFVDNGTTATLLARRWSSASLVNVDNLTLQRVLDNPKALAAIMKIEGFRSLGSNIIETIVNKSNKIKDLKKKTDIITEKEKKELTEEEREFKSKRREVQEKLMKFATRIPIFMYLTDYREEALTDIIRKLEPELFEKITGLTIEDFELLVSVGVFNDAQMNDAILKFRRYENSSLSYVGINKHEKEEYVGVWSGKVTTVNIIKAKI